MSQPASTPSTTADPWLPSIAGLRWPAEERDPWRWCLLICAIFAALLAIRLHIPSRIYFDEVHYVKAARILLSMERPQNAEHPMVGKELLAAGMWLFGDSPRGWRIMPALFGTFGLFAFSRLLWQASRRRAATIAGTVLLAIDFAWYIQSRIAMLDIFMAVFAVVAFWQIASALREQRMARWHLATAGICLGLAMGAKWSVIGPALVPGAALLLIRLAQHSKRFLWASNGPILPGISLIEAGVWLGLLPLLTYWLSFAPTWFYAERAASPWAMIEYHEYMVRLQESVTKKHTYMTHWWQWVLDLRGVWYLYENVDGSQRGIVLIGNPVVMWAGLPALGWCLWAGLRRGRRDMLALALLYLAAIGMWVGNSKPVQFYYHYLLPGTLLMACLALALDDLWARRDRWRWLAAGTMVLALAVFVYFFPIISAAKLNNGKPSFEAWMLLRSWR